MRALIRVCSAAALAVLAPALIAGAARAQTEPSKAADEAVLDPLTPPKPADTPLIAPGAEQAKPLTAPVPAESHPVVLELRRRLEAAGAAGSPAERADRAGLLAFYAEGDGRPLWLDAKGYSPRASAVIEELKRAADYGLDPAAFEIPSPPVDAASTETLAEIERRLGLSVLLYARHARGGRTDPASISRMIDMRPRLFEPRSVMQGVAIAGDAGAYLAGLNPKHAGFQNLRKALQAARGPVEAAPPAPTAAEPAVPPGPTIRLGQRHDHVALVRQRLGHAAAADSTALDKDLAIALKAWQREHGVRPTGLIDPPTRSALNRRPAPARPPSENVQRILVNMERWRWMPDELGSFHVWDNVPEQFTRVIKDGKAILTERIVVGKPNTPTPVFSADMRFVIFHPSWGVPEGIKTNELGPMLRRAGGNGGGWLFGGGGAGASSVLARHGLRVSHNGREVNPDSIDWSSVDVRQFHFTQPPSGSNVLGVVKFRFPNRFDVYMHDTPERHLFNSGTRAFSHGCMRVQNPMRLAEVILAHDKGWSAEKVNGFVSHGGTSDITLSTPIPVHVTYFTASADDSGKLAVHSDLYGMDGRVASALAGKPVHLASTRISEPDDQASGATPARQGGREASRRGRTREARTSEPFNPFGNLSAN